MDEVAKLLSPAYNFAVVQLPGRQYPGVVMQGDTLRNSVVTLSRVLASLNPDTQEDIYFDIEELKEQLEGALHNYQRICTLEGIHPPGGKLPT
jgi:hypothetical protein